MAGRPGTPGSDRPSGGGWGAGRASRRQGSPLRATADPRSPRPDVAEEAEVAGPPPFFIVGCGRSGTTLLRAMLNSHSQLAVPLESLFIVDYLEASDDVSAATLRRMLPREHELRGACARRTWRGARRPPV